MSFKSLLKAAFRAAPVILATAPAVIAAVKEVKRAVKKGPDAPAGPAAAVPAATGNRSS